MDLKNVIDNLPSAVFVVDQNRKIVMANKMAENLSGQDECLLISLCPGEALGCVYALDSAQGCGVARECRFCATREAVKNVFQKKENIPPFETSIKTKLHSTLQLKVTVTLLQHDLVGDGLQSETFAIVTVDDVTAYRQREKLQSALETMGASCHALNQPLMVLSGQLELLALEIGRTPRVDKLQKQVERISDITRKLNSAKAYERKPHQGEDTRFLELERSST